MQLVARPTDTTAFTPTCDREATGLSTGRRCCFSWWRPDGPFVNYRSSLGKCDFFRASDFYSLSVFDGCDEVARL
jgi:hypothetical protein